MSIALDLQSAAVAMGGVLSGENAIFCGVSTDSRSLAAGALFFALRGERFDGHAFVATVKSCGAAAAVVATDTLESLKDCTLPLIAVEDTRLALGRLAASWRARFDLPVVAVTGSNGKTTTKEMIASILRAGFGDGVLATQGNFNNEIGLPLTLLELNDSHRAVVIEMGMNHPGEIAYLTRIAQPGVAVVTNAQRAHLAGMGNLASVAEEKGSLFLGLPESGVGVVNIDDDWAGLWRRQCGAHRIVTCSFAGSAEVCGAHREHGLESRLEIRIGAARAEIALALPGGHNARNALVAAAAAWAVGLPLPVIAQGLGEFRGVKGRLQRRAACNGASLLDDTYNANPDSVCAAIDVLAATVGRKILVLGDMGEIGEMSGQFHDEVGGYAKSQGIDRLLTLGEASALAAHNFGAGGQHCASVDELVGILQAELTPQTTVLVKGSRFMRMERVSNAVAVDRDAPQQGEK